MIRRISLLSFAVVLMVSLPVWSEDGSRSQGWPQWGQNPQHTGTANVSGQRVKALLDDVVYDPFVEAEKTDPTFGDGDLHVHYQVPLTDGDDVYMEFKTGVFTGFVTRGTQIWNEKKLHQTHGQLSEVWSFESDWKPVPFFSFVTGNGPFLSPSSTPSWRATSSTSRASAARSSSSPSPTAACWRASTPSAPRSTRTPTPSVRSPRTPRATSITTLSSSIPTTPGT